MAKREIPYATRQTDARGPESPAIVAGLWSFRLAAIQNRIKYADDPKLQDIYHEMICQFHAEWLVASGQRRALPAPER